MKFQFIFNDGFAESECRFDNSKGMKFNCEKGNAKESNYVHHLDAINFKYLILLMVPETS